MKLFFQQNGIFSQILCEIIGRSKTLLKTKLPCQKPGKSFVQVILVYEFSQRIMRKQIKLMLAEQ